MLRARGTPGEPAAALQAPVGSGAQALGAGQSPPPDPSPSHHPTSAIPHSQALAAILSATPSPSVLCLRCTRQVSRGPERYRPQPERPLDLKSSASTTIWSPSWYLKRCSGSGTSRMVPSCLMKPMAVCFSMRATSATCAWG